MKTFGIATTAAILLLASLGANAQFEPVPSPHKRTSVDGLKRHLFEQTSALPDELALESLLTAVALDSTREEREIRIDQIQQIMGMAQGQARHFQQYLIKVNRDYEKDLHRLHERMACSAEGQPKTGDEVYTLFEAMYSARRALLSQYLAIIASDLTDAEYARFQGWLDDSKLDITYYTTHHKDAYEAAGTDPNQKLTDICNYLLSVTP